MRANKKNIFERYYKTEEFIKKIYGSRVKTKILLSLTNEPIRLSEISDFVGCKHPNTSSELKELYEMNLIDNKNKRYSLTVSGSIIKHKLVDLINFLDGSESYGWLLNHFTDVPDPFIRELESLINSQKIKNGGSNLLCNQDLFNCTGDLKLITPLFNTNLLNLMVSRTSRDLTTELIVTPATVRFMSKLKKQEEYNEHMNFLVNSPKFKVMAMENNLEVGLGVNESLMSLGLYRIGNTYDFTSHYTSSEGDAVEFADELFKHYKSISEEIDKDEL